MGTQVSKETRKIHSHQKDTTPPLQAHNFETTPLSRDEKQSVIPESTSHGPHKSSIKDATPSLQAVYTHRTNMGTPVSKETRKNLMAIKRTPHHHYKLTTLKQHHCPEMTTLKQHHCPEMRNKVSFLRRSTSNVSNQSSIKDTTTTLQADNSETTPLSRDKKESIIAESTSHASDQSSKKDTTTTLQADNSETAPLSRDEKESIMTDSTSHASMQSSTQDSTTSLQDDNFKTSLSSFEKESTMTESNPVCRLCIQQNKTTTPTVWCNNCRDLLCQDCESRHRDATATKEHYVIPFDDYKKLPTFVLNTKFYCMEHSITYTHFCHIHDKALCIKCTEMFHKKCKYVSKIEDIIQNVKESVAFERNMTDIEAICRKLKTFVDNREANLIRLKQKSEQMKMEVYNKKTLKKKTILKIESVYKELTNEMSGTLDIVKSKEKELCEIINKKNDMITCTNNFQFFIVIKELEHIVYEINKDIENLYKNEQLMEISIEFKMNKKDKVGRGKVRVIKKPSAASIYTSNPTVAQVHTWHPVQLRLQQRIGLQSYHYHYGCCTLHRGLVVIADYGDLHYDDCKVLIHNSEGSLRSTIKFDEGEVVYDVTPVDDHHVAVSHPFTGTISIINVDSDQVVKWLKIGGEVRGLCCKGRDIVCCVGGKGLVRVNIDSGKVKTVVNDKNVDYDSHVEVSNRLICYTCPDTHSVKVLDTHYNVIFTYKDWAVLYSPTGVTIDDHSNIYVTGFASGNLVMISSDGKSCHQLLGHDDALVYPTAVHYDSSTDKLVVVNHVGGPAFIYSVE